MLTGEGDLKNCSEHEERHPVSEGPESVQWSRCEDWLQAGHCMLFGMEILIKRF